MGKRGRGTRRGDLGAGLGLHGMPGRREGERKEGRRRTRGRGDGISRFGAGGGGQPMDGSPLKELEMKRGHLGVGEALRRFSLTSSPRPACAAAPSHLPVPPKATRAPGLWPGLGRHQHPRRSSLLRPWKPVWVLTCLWALSLCLPWGLQPQFKLQPAPGYPLPVTPSSHLPASHPHLWRRDLGCSDPQRPWLLRPLQPGGVCRYRWHLAQKKD